jgi:hypothetical protein
MGQLDCAWLPHSLARSVQVSSESFKSSVSVQVSSPEYLLPKLHGVISQLEGLAEIYGQSSAGKSRMGVQMAKDAIAQCDGTHTSIYLRRRALSSLKQQGD